MSHFDSIMILLIWNIPQFDSCIINIKWSSLNVSILEVICSFILKFLFIFIKGFHVLLHFLSSFVHLSFHVLESLFQLIFNLKEVIPSEEGPFFHAPREKWNIKIRSSFFNSLAFILLLWLRHLYRFFLWWLLALAYFLWCLTGLSSKHSSLYCLD